MDKYGFVYIWFDRYRKMYYIGCHWGTETDGYICSSNRMRDAYRRRPHDFKRRILKTNISREDLLSEEFKWLSLIKPEELRIKYYNLNTHHFGHWTNDQDKLLSVGEKISASPNRASNISKANKGQKRSEETKQKIRAANIGKKLSEKTRQKMSEASKGNKYNIGHKHSDETKRKMSEAKKGKPGRKWTEEQK